MSNHKPNGAGYYIALVLCAAAIGITGYVFHRNADQPEQAAVRETWEDIPVGTLTQEDIPVIATEPPQASQIHPSLQETTPQPPATAPREPLKTCSPVSGEEIFGYSMEVLSYNQTTRDWRVHNGVDLAAEAGTPVLAAADGEVYSVLEDEALGHSVTIRHSDGYTTCYCSLAEQIPVQPGDTVTMGQAIGYAGESAIVETALGSHVHFSVTRYGEPVDPGEFLALGR